MSAPAMPPVFTVSQVVAMMKDCLERRFPSVDIEAEISNWRLYPSGHCYFALKDAGAQIGAVLFARVPCDCRASLCDGRRVKARGRISVYPQRGECQFVVTRIKLAGEGELMAKYLALKAKLENEGLFASTRKKPLPRFPRRIAIVTSPAGAVIHDMCGVLTRRFPNLEIRLYPALVQGADAPRSLVAGVEYFSRLAVSEGDWKPDLLIVARGGGSFEDLFCFNDEALVRTLAACPIPTISAVGHETDYTLCDFAADVRAGTPSIAAEIAVPVLDEIKRSLTASAAALAERLRSRGDALSQHLDRLSDALAASMRSRMERTSEHLAAASRSLSASLRTGVESASMRVSHLTGRLPRAVSIACERAEARLERDRSRLSLLSPYAVLERGYSLTTDASGGVVRDAGALRPGDMITTRLMQGTVRSCVAG